MAASRQASIGAAWSSARRSALSGFRCRFFLLTNAIAPNAQRFRIQQTSPGLSASHLSNSLGEVDRTLSVIVVLYAQRPENFDLLGLAQKQPVVVDAISRVSIVDRNGIVRLSSDVSLRGTNVKDRAYFLSGLSQSRGRRTFRRQANLVADAPGKWTLELSRRIKRADGQFDGVVAASLDLGYLTQIDQFGEHRREGVQMRHRSRRNCPRHERRHDVRIGEGFFSS